VDASFVTGPDFRPRWQALLAALLPVALALAVSAVLSPGAKPSPAAQPLAARR
jgi:hypothetical protein